MDGCRLSRARTGGIAAACAVAIAPWLVRLRWSNIIGDDVQRIVDLQTLSLPQRMARPFNEHLAPLFELYTAGVWKAAGERLVNVPIAFTVATYAPYALCLLGVFLLVRREWKSELAAGLAVVLFASPPVYAECVLWFSAATFAMALALAIFSLILAGKAADDRSLPAAIGAAIACFLAPMGSAVGLLAGPAASLRAFPSRADECTRRPLAIAALPMLGTLANLLLASLLRYHEVVSRSVQGSRDIAGGLLRGLQAPLYLLMTGYGGSVHAEKATSVAAGAVLLLFAAAGFAWAFQRSETHGRRWLLIGAFWMAAGYVLIYGFRTTMVGADRLVTVQRYHLFPCLGLVLIVVAASASRLRRLEARPLAGPASLIALAIALMLIGRPVMRDRMNYYRHQSDQHATLAMMDRLSDAARARGFSRAEVLGAFQPLEPRWAIDHSNALAMLPETATPPKQPAPPHLVRTQLLAALPEADRTWLVSDMDATALLRPVAAEAEAPGGDPFTLTAARMVEPLDRPGLYRSGGWPGHLEFASSGRDPAMAPRAIVLPDLQTGQTVEVWWTEGAEEFSDARRVLIRPNAGGRASWALPLDQLPVPPRHATRLRIAPRGPGTIAIGAPRLIR